MKRPILPRRRESTVYNLLSQLRQKVVGCLDGAWGGLEAPRRRAVAMALWLVTLAGVARAQTNAPAWPTNALTLNDTLELALRQSPAILKGRQDIEAAHGLALQLKAASLPRLQGGGRFRAVDESSIEVPPIPGATLRFQSDKSWGATIEVSQPVYTAGKMSSARRSARFTRDAALAQYQALVADTLLSVRITYDDALLAAEQIKTQEASVALLEEELGQQKRRFDAGTVPRFNVLRAEVELANARPRLFRARNAHRIAKNRLATQLGWTVPREADSDIPLTLADTLTADPYEVQLGAAVMKALRQRPELNGLRTQERLREEDIKQARADYFPQVGVAAGWTWQNRTFADQLATEIDGWTAGAQANWSIWDFGLTKGKVEVARARQEKARLETGDATLQIELEVRTAHSSFQEAKDVLESQEKVIEQAQEALRLANARAEAGTGTQLDVLSAQTALTDSRSTYSLALRDYRVARARLERALGEGLAVRSGQ